MGPTVTFNIINKEYNKCKWISSERQGWQEGLGDMQFDILLVEEDLA